MSGFAHTANKQTYCIDEKWRERGGIDKSVIVETTMSTFVSLVIVLKAIYFLNIVFSFLANVLK